MSFINENIVYIYKIIVGLITLTKPEEITAQSSRKEFLLYARNIHNGIF